MRFICGLICLTAAVSAQNATADFIVYPRARVVQLPAGSSKNGITIGSSQAVFNQLDSVTGTLSMTNKVSHFDNKESSANQIVQSYIQIQGAADNGLNWYSIATAMYDNDSPRASLSKNILCGNVTNLQVTGYQAIPAQLSTSYCSVSAISSFVQTNVGGFVHSITTSLTKPKTASTLLLGSNSYVNYGYASYPNASASAVPLDVWYSDFVQIQLESAMTLTVTGSVAALLILTSF